MIGRARFAFGFRLASALLLAWGCGDTDGGGGASGGSAGKGSGGRTGLGGSGGAAAGKANTGGTQPGGAAGEANAGAGAEVNGGAGGVTAGGAAGEIHGGAGAGGGAAGGSAAGAGQAGGGAAGASAGESGAGGSAGSGEDPACQAIDAEARLTSHLRITADNECDVFVNGVSAGTTNNWGVAVTVDVSLFLHPGRKNVVAIVGRNTSSQGGNDRGIIGELTVDVTSGTAPLLVTDSAWRVSQTDSAGWTGLGFDDSSWVFATEVAAVGDPPWGNVIPNSAAKWIWFAPIPVDTGAKPNLETTYARREFYLSLDGSTTKSTPSCAEPSGP